MTAYHGYVRGPWPLWSWPQRLPFNLWRSGHAANWMSSDPHWLAQSVVLPALFVRNGKH